jgi:hypothetical protein
MHLGFDQVVSSKNLLELIYTHIIQIPLKMSSGELHQHNTARIIAVQ